VILYRVLTSVNSGESRNKKIKKMDKSKAADDIPSNVTNISDSKNTIQELRSWQRFHIRLTALYGGAMIITLAVLAVNVYFSDLESEFKGLQKRLLNTANGLAVSIDAAAIDAIPLDNEEMTPLHVEIQRRFKEVAAHDDDIETIYILRPTSEPTKLRFFVDYAKAGDSAVPGKEYDASDLPVMLKGFKHPTVEDEPYADEWGLSLSGYSPIYDKNGRSIGIVGVDVKLTHIKAIQMSVLNNIFFAFGVSIVLVGIVAWYVARNVRVPLTKIIDAAVAISRGNLATRIRMQRSDELGLMGNHIDKMAAQLEEREFIRETFGKYMSEDIAKELLAKNKEHGLGGEERVVTVLFCDMQKYSTISEQMPPGHIVEMLNQYLGAMTEIIDKHHGCVIEFIGDAIFAVFGAPRYIADHAEQAVRCAIEMHRRLNLLNKELEASGITRFWKSNSPEGLDIRIGIHTGQVIAGNLGSSTRMKYAVIGDTVNIASRLETLNKELNTHTLISRNVYTQLPEELINLMQSQGEQNIKGREQGITVYSIQHEAKKPNLSVVPLPQR